MSNFPRTGETGSVSVGGKVVIYGTSDGGTTWYPIVVDSDGRLSVVSGLVPESYDYIELSYTGSDLTGVVYKTNGVGGTTVATLALGYDGNSNLTSVART